MAEKTSFMDGLRSELGIPKNKEKEDPKPKEEEEEEEVEEEEEEEEDSKEEEHKEEEEEETEEEEPSITLKKNKREKAKTKGDQIRELRASKDEWKRKYEELESKHKTLSKTASEEGSELIALIEDRFGSLGKDAKEKIESLVGVEDLYAKTKEELESLKKDIDIKSSSEWKEDYEKPYLNAQDVFYASIVNTDADGSIPHKAYFEQFASSLAEGALKEGSINATQVKTAIKKFAKLYEDKTGEEYDEPNISEVVSSLRSMINIATKANQAYTDWDKTKKNRTESQKLQEAEKSEKLKRIEKRERKSMASKALNSFNIEALEGIIDEEEIEKEFQKVFEENEQQFEDPSKASSYDQVITLLAKGRMFDDLLKRYQDDLKGYKIKKKANESVKGNDRFEEKKEFKKNKPGERIWLPSPKDNVLAR